MPRLRDAGALKTQGDGVPSNLAATFRRGLKGQPVPWGGVNRLTAVEASYRLAGPVNSCLMAAALRMACCCMGPGMAADCSLNFWPSWILVRSPMALPKL